MDALTSQIVQALRNLPISKKRAILEFLKVAFAGSGNHIESFQENWKKELLATSVWTDDEINEIHEARRFVNQWTPVQFS
jgi:hypothetical protein